MAHEPSTWDSCREQQRDEAGAALTRLLEFPIDRAQVCRGEAAGGWVVVTWHLIGRGRRCAVAWEFREGQRWGYTSRECKPRWFFPVPDSLVPEEVWDAVMTYEEEDGCEA